MPPFNSFDTWQKEQFFDLGYNANANYGGDVDVEYDTEDGTYYIAIKDNNNSNGDGIAIISSTDPAATTWTDEGRQAATTDTAYGYVTDPSLIEVNGTWYLYFSAGGGGNDQQTDEIYVGVASSPTGSYSIQSTGITTGSSGEFDDVGVGETSVVYDAANERWVLSYTAAEQSDGAQQSVGLALSDNGTDFTKFSGNPVKDGSWSGASKAIDQFLFNAAGAFSMYYNDDGNVDMGRATATDLNTWVDVSHNPILKSLQTEDGNGVFAPTFVIVNNTAHMWYTAHDSDGSTFHRAYVTGSVTSDAGSIKQYDGSQFQERPVHRYTGSVWQRAKGVKQYDGSEFITTPPEASPTIVDDFEDFDASEYGVTDVAGEVTIDSMAPVFHGSASLKMMPSASTNSLIASTSGLNAYPSLDDTYAVQLYHKSTTKGGVVYFVQDSSNYYMAQLDSVNGIIKFFRKESGSFNEVDSVSVAVATETEYRIEINPQSGGTHDITLYEEGVGQQASMSPSDSTFTSGGIGWRNGPKDNNFVVDNARLLP